MAEIGKNCYCRFEKVYGAIRVECGVYPCNRCINVCSRCTEICIHEGEMRIFAEKKQTTMKTEERKTRIVRSYSKKELALAYAPELTIGGAVKRLGVWIKYNPQLWMELQKRGYRTRQKLFTPQQVDVIFQYLGEP